MSQSPQVQTYGQPQVQTYGQPQVQQCPIYYQAPAAPVQMSRCPYMNGQLDKTQTYIMPHPPPYSVRIH